MVAGGSSVAATEWYRDPAGLLAALREGGASRCPPVNLPGYEHLYKIGQGGQGVVYSAYQRSTRRQVAIKFLRDRPWGEAGARIRFEREVELAARLRHPNVVSVFDSGVTPDGSLFCVMEYIDGVPLNRHLDRRRAESERKPRGERNLRDELLRLFGKICEAVSFAHQRGIIHRDLKPKNILIDSDGRPHIVDFGLAKPTNDWPAESFTQSGAFVGTLAYAAPEQLQADPSAIDVRTDVYALGVLLYEMLAGRPPYAATGSMAEIVRAIQEIEPVPPSRFAPLDDDLDAIVLTALAKDPGRRYQSVDALQRDVERFLAGEAVEAKRDSRWYVIKKTAAANKGAVLVGLAFVLVVLAFGGGMAVLYRQASWARDNETLARARAEQEARKARQSLEFLQQVLASVSPSDAGREVTVRQALDATAARIASIPAAEPDLRVAACLTVGNTYGSLGLYTDAAEYLENALTTLRALRSEDDADVAAAKSNLAAVSASLGRYDAAERLYREALNAYRKAPDAHAPLIALTLNNLCGVLLQKGSVTEAEPVCREALALNRKLFGGNAHPDLALSVSNLAGVNYSKSAYGEAETLFRQALDMYRSLYGGDHPVIAYSMNNLALALAGRREYREAEEWHRRALELRWRLLGDRHPDVANSLYNLAEVLDASGKSEEAKRCCRESLAVQEKALPAGHVDTARTRVLLGLLCLKRGADDEAEPLFSAAHAAFAMQFGPDHPRSREIAQKIERAYQIAGHADAAGRWRDRISPAQALK